MQQYTHCVECDKASLQFHSFKCEVKTDVVRYTLDSERLNNDGTNSTTGYHHTVLE